MNSTAASRPYEALDAGTQVAEIPPLLEVSVGVAGGGPSGRCLYFEPEKVGSPTIPGVGVSKAHTVINERRTLIVTNDPTIHPGVLGYTVTLRPSCSAGDHSHHRREERIVLVFGRVIFRLEDMRDSRHVVNQFRVDEPGVTVLIPVEVAHSVVAEGGPAVIQVLASTGYDPDDDEHVQLSGTPVG